WQATGPLTLAGDLPLPTAPIHQECLARERFFLNYCTYGYTFPYLNAAGWQRFLDWLALNGVNRPLLQGGQEAVWLEVWQKYGLTTNQVLAYFTGPAYLPWHRMSNLDHFGGPLPLSYIAGQKRLQQQLVAQARALGMRPVLSAFAGHVPAELKASHPAAKITQIRPGWGGFGAAEACWFLDPLDPLFAEVQRDFLKIQTELYGSDHAYAADPFNEIDPPSWSPDFMAGVGRGMYQSLTASDPAAVWYQMTWTFTGRWMKPSPAGPTPFRALCEAVPAGRMVLIDYVGEERELYRSTDGFYGATFLWDYIGNYGGNTYFRAPLSAVAGKVARALTQTNCAGVGCAPEGVAVNQAIYQLILEQPWHAGGVVDVHDWIQHYAESRVGRADPQFAQAWTQLLDTVLDPGPQGHFDRGSAITQLPSVAMGAKEGTAPATALAGKVASRDPRLIAGLVAALDTALQADAASQQADGYRYDLVNWLRQAMAYQSDIIKARMLQARQKGDTIALARETRRLLDLIQDLDELTATRPEFLLGPWLRDARAWGATPAEADYYEQDARRIITAWGAGLGDYAHREWNGLLRDYYLPRWWDWARTNVPTAVVGESAPAGSLDFLAAKSAQYAEAPVGDAGTIVRRFLAKYRQDMLGS
ncbi:MAG TPA: alpha-N-acetylglucosaminidase, partial [Verrucomicrobiae bacterium]